jgi:hypothetical protein
LAIVLNSPNRAAYNVAFPALDADLIGNMNQNGNFDFGDTASFSALFGGPVPKLCPSRWHFHSQSFF